MASMEGFPTWDIYKLWSAIACVAGAVERRVYVHNLAAAPPLYPNLFIGLIGPPSNGKTFGVGHCLKGWKSTNILKIAPDKITGAALIDEINEATRVIPMAGSSRFVTYHSIQMPITEMSSLIPEYEATILSILNKLYDNETMVERLRNRPKGQPQKITIPNAQANIITGGQPDYLAATMPAVAWGQGFLSRFIFIWAPHREPSDPFDKSGAKQKFLQLQIEDDLKQLCHLQGEMQWTDEAQEVSRKWLFDGGQPRPTHPKLEHYCGRRWIHLTKLSMVSSLSRSNSLIIGVQDWERALSWLLEAEKEMPTIFSQMSSAGGDGTLLFDTWNFCNEYLQKHNLQSIPERTIISYIANRIGAMSVMKVLENLTRSGMITKVMVGDTRDGFCRYYIIPQEKWNAN